MNRTNEISKADPQVAALFDAAAELERPADRDAYLNRFCSDPQVRAEVESLLAAHEHPDTVFTGNTGRLDPSAETVGTVIGPYKLLEAIGEGGFGTVWLAEQKTPVRRKVALKIIKLGMDTRQVVARFEAERQALALMDHPNIAKVIDAGATEAGRPYFVMELVRGIPITTFCDHNKLPTRDRIELFIKVCHAIQHAHQKGIIHRDVKPSNVLVTLHDGVPVPKVIDFGIAKATHQELTDKTIHTHFHQFVGTPAYVSPEQAEMSGLDIDTRSDIYSLGVLLYELLTGSTPFDARALMASGLEEMRRTIRETEPIRPSARLSTLSMDAATDLARHRQEKLPALISLIRGDLDWIVLKCMEKDRTRRYDTANGVAADLKRHLSDEPVTARPPSAGYRLQKAIHRNRLAFAAGAAIAAALLIGTTVAGVMAWRATKAERAQREMRVEAEQSRSIAQANEQKARDEAAKSSQAAKFIQSILTGLDLAATQGDDRKLLFEILMRAQRRAETELSNQPEVQIEVVSSISQCLERLGMASHSYEIAVRAMVLAKAAFGAESPRAAELMTVAAARAVFYEKMDDAEALAQRAVAILRRAYGPAHASTLAAMRELGRVYVETGRPGQAESVLREHMQFAARALATDDEGQWTSRVYLGRALTALSRPAEAEPLLREAAVGYERTVTATSQRATTAAHLYCQSLFQQGKLVEAETFARRWASRLREVQINHPAAVELHLVLAKVLSAVGKDAEAGRILRDMFDVCRGSWGAKLPVTGDVMDELARWYRSHDQDAAADNLPRLLRERVAAAPVKGSAALLARMVSLEAKLRADNMDAHAAMELAAEQAWLGRTNEWRATSRGIVERVSEATFPPSLDRAAKSAALAPGADRDVLEKAAVLARRALASSTESTLSVFYKMCVGMVEYRRGNYAAADAHLAEAKASFDEKGFRGLTAAHFYRAMIAMRQARQEDARRFFATGESAMTPFPQDESAPLDSGGDFDDLITWLAYREALAMLNQ